MKEKKYIICSIVSMLDAFIYGLTLSYMNYDQEIWAVMRYVILFVSMYSLEAIFQDVKKNIKNKIYVCATGICMVALFLLGYVLATSKFMSIRFLVVLIIMITIGILELKFLMLIIKSEKEVKTEVIKELTMKEITVVLENENDVEKKQYVRCSMCSGTAIIILSIMMFIVPIFVRHSNIELSSLFLLGGLLLCGFCIANYKKYILFNNKKSLLPYYIETTGVLICMVCKYYVDGFVYRGKSFSNIILNIIYTLLLIPFLLSTRKIENEITKKIRND